MSKEEQPDAPETELLRRAVTGDEDGLAALLERYGPVVRARLAGEISSHLQSVLSEDDIMQQTYVDAFRDIRNFVPQGEGAFLAWLLTLSRRNLLDAIKMLEADKRGGGHRQVQSPAGSDSYVALYELLGSSGTTPSKQAAQEEANSTLKQAIQELPEVYRQIVTMYDLENRPIEEVAVALERSRGAAFMLRSRAHAHLRKKMGSASKFFSDSA